MSLVPDAIADALAQLNAATGQPVIEYRAGTSGAWNTLTGAYFYRSEAMQEFSDQRLAEEYAERGTLLTPESAPVLLVEYQVRLASDDTEVWTVIEGPTGIGQRRYGLHRTETGISTVNRGRLEQ